MKLANSSLDICSLLDVMLGVVVSPIAAATAASAVSSSSLHKSASKLSRSGSSASIYWKTIINLSLT